MKQLFPSAYNQLSIRATNCVCLFLYTLGQSIMRLYMAVRYRKVTNVNWEFIIITTSDWIRKLVHNSSVFDLIQMQQH